LLISDSYKRLSSELHASKDNYGAGGARHAGDIVTLADRYRCETILDYGCGKGDLKRALMLRDVREYDPGIEGKDTLPEPADLVHCGDVLEHVEPECLEAVMDDLQRLTLKVCLLVVHTGAAAKHFPDGRNLHLTQQPVRWWLPKLMARWDLAHASVGPNGFMFTGKKCTQST